MELYNSNQRSCLRKHNGTRNSECVANVWHIIQSLPSIRRYKQEQEKLLPESTRKIANVCEKEGLQKEMFNIILDYVT